MLPDSGLYGSLAQSMFRQRHKRAIQATEPLMLRASISETYRESSSLTPYNMPH